MNAWVVVKPDESVVIRVARSEMGQGTLTGLCQLVAEELECDWSKVTYEFPTPGENLARKRVWSDFFTAGSRGIRASHEIVRKGGAAARDDADRRPPPSEWKVPAAECTAIAGRDHPHQVRPHHHLRQGRRVRPQRSSRRPTSSSRTRRTGRSSARASSASTPPLKVKGRGDLRHRRQAAGHAQRRHQGVPGVRRQGEELRRRQGRVDEGREEGRAGRGQCRRCHRRHLVERQDRAGSAADRVGRRPERQGLQRDRSPNCSRPASMPTRRSSATRAATSKRRWPARPRRSRRSTPIRTSTMSPWSRRTPPCSTRRRSARCGPRCRTASRRLRRPSEAVRSSRSHKCEFYKTFLGGGFGRRSTSVDYVRQAVLVAKEMPGTPVKLLWSREEDMTHGWYHPITQCKMTAGFDDKNNLTALHIRISGPVDPRDGSAGPHAERHGSGDLRGLLQGRRGSGVRLRRAEPADRPCHAQSARTAGLLARRQHQPQRHLHRELHG